MIKNNKSINDIFLSIFNKNILSLFWYFDINKEHTDLYLKSSSKIERLINSITIA